jgi:excisionase family DNA binding protein
MERAAWTPRQLAERWECSERHVRNLINRGELQFFRLGGKLIRIPQSAVEAFERCQILSQSSESSPTAASSRLSGTTKAESDNVRPEGRTIFITMSPRCKDLMAATTRAKPVRRA